MRGAGVLLLLALLSAGRAASADPTPLLGPVAGGYQMSAALEHPIVDPGDPIYADVSIRNLASKTEFFTESLGDMASFRITVLNSHHEPMPVLAYGKATLYPGLLIGSSARIPLPVGAVRKYQLWISGMFDMSVPDTYTIEIRRRVITGYYTTHGPATMNRVEQDVAWLGLPALTVRVLGEKQGLDGDAAGYNRQTVLYAVNGIERAVHSVSREDATRGSIDEFIVSPGGDLSPLVPGTCRPGEQPREIAVDGERRRAYVAITHSGTIAQYSIAPGGSMVPLDPPTVPSGGAPMSIALEPRGRYAYAANDQGTVAQFRINPAGGLEPLTSALAPAGRNPVSIAVDRNGQFAYVANACVGGPQALISQYRIGDGGLLSPLNPPTCQTYGAPSVIAVNPAGNLAVAITTMGLEPLRIGADGTLSAVDPRNPVPAGNLPVSLAFTPDGRHLYVASGNGDTVCQYRVRPEGRVEPLAPPTVPAWYPQSITVDPTGFRVYAGQRTGNLVEWTVQADGTLSPVDPGPLVQHESPGGAVSSVGAVSLPVDLPWGPVGDGLQLAAWLDRPTFHADQPIWLHVILRNTSTRNVVVGGSAFERTAFHLEVRDAQGKLAPMTRYGQEESRFPTAVYRNVLLTVPARGQLHYDFQLNRLFDMTQAPYERTIYTVHVERPIPGSAGNPPTTLHAPEIMLRVLAPKYGPVWD